MPVSIFGEQFLADLYPNGVPATELASLHYEDVQKYKTTGPIAEDAVHHYRAGLPKIVRLLDRFLGHQLIVGQFQKLQDSTGFLISGSVALQYFTEDYYTTDLNLFCYIDGCSRVAGWLSDIGYQFTARQNQSEDFNNEFNSVRQKSATENPSVIFKDYLSLEIVAVWNFEWKSQLIQLVAVRASPLAAVLSFHSSCVMNFLSHQVAYCLFPETTLNEKKNLILNMHGSQTALAVAKYAHRGFELFTHASKRQVVDPKSDLSIFRFHSTDDARCRKEEIKWICPSKPAPDFLRGNSWQLRYEGTAACLEYDCIPVQDAKRKYIVSPLHVSYVRRGLMDFTASIQDGTITGDAAMTLILRGAVRRSTAENLGTKEFLMTSTLSKLYNLMMVMYGVFHSIKKVRMARFGSESASNNTVEPKIFCVNHRFSGTVIAIWVLFNVSKWNNGMLTAAVREHGIGEKMIDLEKSGVHIQLHTEDITP
ncbi:hypothetical protein GYMLUDRAFT_60086 [Collybiopsis luxurians FD-317 M1]|uniref:Uncharacterized protein n=1 Tax=Collybiopsis luxurians FD-317 M1 TaxID=944289 RepID=A0A0D0CAR3_9AGAR|nr:hypothetical protein GYMLUDRAFT_60086 [Collybiopsis luxurians FD-317 M1]